MTRKSRCSNCGQWYYNDNSLMIYRFPEYDPSMCQDCNAEIDAQIANRTPKIKFYANKE